MKASALVLCNNILIRAKNERIAVTPMKLQKLLYYVCVSYVQKTGALPISEQFEVWAYGPVIPSVYSEFKPYGARPITDFYRNVKKEAMMVDESANPILSACIANVWNNLKMFSGTALSERTHQKGSGWYSAYQQYHDTVSVEEMLNDATI